MEHTPSLTLYSCNMYVSGILILQKQECWTLTADFLVELFVPYLSSKV